MPQEDEKKLKRRLARVQGIGSLTWFSGVYPLVVLLLVLVTWTVAWVQLGHAPRKWLDDPKQIGAAVLLLLEALYSLATIWIVAALISTAFWSIGILSRFLQRDGRLWPVAIPLLAWGALVGLVHWDPGSVLEWLVD